MRRRAPRRLPWPWLASVAVHAIVIVVLSISALEPRPQRPPELWVSVMAPEPEVDVVDIDDFEADVVESPPTDPLPDLEVPPEPRDVPDVPPEEPAPRPVEVVEDEHILREPETVVVHVDPVLAPDVRALVRPRRAPVPPPPVPPPPRETPAVARAAVVGAVPAGTNRAPVYPPAARSERRQGDVRLRIWISALGVVERAEVATGSGQADLDAAAIEAALGWRFRPKTVDGVPVAAVVVQTVQFRADS